MREIVVELEDGSLERATEKELREYLGAAKIAPSVRVWIDGVPTTLGTLAESSIGSPSSIGAKAPVALLWCLILVAAFLASLIVAILLYRSNERESAKDAPVARETTEVENPPSVPIDAPKERESSPKVEESETPPIPAPDVAPSVPTEPEIPTVEDESTEVPLIDEETPTEDDVAETKEISDEKESETSEETKEDDETKAETIYVPEDFETIAEALDFVADGGEIVIKKRSKPYNLGISERFLHKRDGRLGALATKSATIRSEFRRPGDVVIRVDRMECLYIQNEKTSGAVDFVGITFKAESERRAPDDLFASARVERGAAEFHNCIFKGIRQSRSVSVYVAGAFSTAKFVDCEFRDSGYAGIWVGQDSNASVVRSTFRTRGAYGVWVEPYAVFNATDSRFEQNALGVYAQTGVEGAVRNCIFDANEENWFIDDAWEQAKIIFVGNRE